MSSELETRLAAVEAENAQLRAALSSRIVIEQAKGVLIERLDLPPEDVFNLLRSAARRARMSIHVVAEEILKSRVTPDHIARQIQHLRSTSRELDGGRPGAEAAH
jgi:AmiR/NasT family two-component response regulator